MRNPTIDSLRGICMLGVIAIHIGSLALAPNSFALYAVLEVLSRYSVPAFFFISGYGLFCQLPHYTTYKDFLSRRLRSAGVPYVAWSLFYMLYYWLVLPPGYVSWHPLHVAYVLFFGLGCYHLYFMVILLWFYVTFPLWKDLLNFTKEHNVKLGLLALLCFQLAFNHWTTHPGIDAATLSPFWQSMFKHRLNYLPFHYLLVFMCGGLAATYQVQFQSLLQKRFITIVIVYLASLAYILGSSYYSYYYESYSLLALANTYHQLSPQGLFYTLGSLLFFCAALPKLKTNGWINKTLAVLSKHSMLIYFIHPLFLNWLTNFYYKYGIVMTVKKVSFSYLLLLFTSLAVSILLTKVFSKAKLLKMIFLGNAE